MTLSPRKWIPEYRDMTTPCWVWQRSTNSRGYPCQRLNGKTVLVHRAHYEAEYGELPAGYQIHHRCEDRLCVNPDHLCARTPFEHAEEHYGESLPSFLSRMFHEQPLWTVADLRWPAHRAGHDRAHVVPALRRLVARGEVERVARATYRLRGVA